jgi:hypothetical protein
MRESPKKLSLGFLKNRNPVLEPSAIPSGAILKSHDLWEENRLLIDRGMQDAL